MRSILTGTLTFAASLGALFVEYPWSTYYENAEVGWWRTVDSYLLVAALLGIIGGTTSGMLSLSAVRTAAVRAALCGFTVLALAVVCAFLFGPGGVNVPGTRVRGIFFSEWQFLNFLGYVATPVSAIAAILCGWATSPKPAPLPRGPDIT